MTLNPYQWQIGSVVMGDGTSYNVIKVSGLDDLPAIRQQDVARGRDHGMWRGTDFADGRTISMDVEIFGSSDSVFRANVDALKAATVIGTPGNTEQPLTFALPSLGGSGNQLVNVRPRRRLVPTTLDYLFHKAQATIEFFATDPRVYDATQSSVTIPVAVASSGFSFNFGFNLGFGTAGSAGSVQVVNAGNFATRPVITIYGPVDNPTLQNVTAGLSLTFAISLGSTDTLTIDLDARSVILNGTASRRNTMTNTSQWWELAPGTSTILYQANTVQVGSTAVMTWRSAWM